MNLLGRPVSIACSVLLAVCACLSGHQLFGMMFAMGESGKPDSFADAFLIATALGIVGLAIGALGSWTRHPFFPLAAIVGAIFVLPQSAVYFMQSFDVAIWQLNPMWIGASGILGPLLDIVAGMMSLLRLLQQVGKNRLPTPIQG